MVKERLDRVLCTWNWQLTFSEAEVLAFPAVGSDHSPLMINTEGQQRRKGKIFKFEAYWLQHQSCQKVIQEAWSLARAKGYNLDWS